MAGGWEVSGLYCRTFFSRPTSPSATSASGGMPGKEQVIPPLYLAPSLPRSLAPSLPRSLAPSLPLKISPLHLSASLTFYTSLLSALYLCLSITLPLFLSTSLPLCSLPLHLNTPLPLYRSTAPPLHPSTPLPLHPSTPLPAQSTPGAQHTRTSNTARDVTLRGRGGDELIQQSTPICITKHENKTIGWHDSSSKMGTIAAAKQ